MFNKLMQFYNLFKQGQQVSNPAFWKKGQAFVQPIVAGLIMSVVALLKSYGYSLPISDDMAVTIAGALFFIVNGVLTVVTSAHIGIPAKPGSVPAAQQALPSVQQRASEEAAQSPMQPVNSAPSQSAPVGTTSIDADVVERAKQWAAEHSKFDNDQNPSYYNP
jgi:hypothetical protein